MPSFCSFFWTFALSFNLLTSPEIKTHFLQVNSTLLAEIQVDRAGLLPFSESLLSSDRQKSFIVGQALSSSQTLISSERIVQLLVAISFTIPILISIQIIFFLKLRTIADLEERLRNLESELGRLKIISNQVQENPNVLNLESKTSAIEQQIQHLLNETNKRFYQASQSVSNLEEQVKLLKLSDTSATDSEKINRSIAEQYHDVETRLKSQLKEDLKKITLQLNDLEQFIREVQNSTNNEKKADKPKLEVEDTQPQTFIPDHSLDAEHTPHNASTETFPYNEFNKRYNSSSGLLPGFVVQATSSDGFVVLEPKEQGDYLLFEDSSGYWLVPKQGFRVNPHSMNGVIQTLFDCQSYELGRIKFKLIQPAIMARGSKTNQWQIVRKGALQFE